ncbi:MAG: alpha/beta fold hydrolase, partial [Opitutaceae bacterium]
MRLAALLFMLNGLVPFRAAGAGDSTSPPAAEAKPPSSTPLYEEDVAASDPIRAEQARELEKYLAARRADPTALHAFFTPDFSSPEAYVRSAEKLRQALRDSLGYPLPGLPDPTESPSFEKIGGDAQGVYYRFRISVLPGVHAVGLYIMPAGLRGRAPLVIALHGGGGSPELATFHGGANYHDLIRGAVAHGYVVLAPQLLFLAPGFPLDIRQRLDASARLLGTTITAIEIAKIAHALDVVLQRPEVDPERVAMIGLSYGGFYTLYTTALEPRIKVAASSGFFNDRAGLFERVGLSNFVDWRFTNGSSLFNDPEIVALVCPRPLLIQVGIRDELFPIEGARQEAPAAAAYYERLHVADRFQFVEFPGTHEF